MTESVDRVGRPSRVSDSYGRTDGRTYGEPSHLGRTSTPFVTRTCAYDEMLIATSMEAVADALEASQTRLAVTRTGKRTPIPRWLRTAIYRRDSYECQWCHVTPWTIGYNAPMHLDHVLPWSAGGSDRSTNLRTMCEHCNDARSNKSTDAPYSRHLPVGYCDECLRRIWMRPAGDDDPVIAFCYQCKRPGPVTNQGRLW